MADPRPALAAVDARDRREFLEYIGFSLEDGRWKPAPDTAGFEEWAVVFANPWRAPFVEALHPYVVNRKSGPAIPRWALALCALLFEGITAVPGFAPAPPEALISDALAWCADSANDAIAAQRAGALLSVTCLGGTAADLRSLMAEVGA